MGRLWRSLFNAHRQHPSQALLVLAGLALSIAVVVAIDLTIASARSAFELSRQALGGQASHQLLAEGGFVAESDYARLKLAHDLRQAAPVLEGSAVVADGERRVQVLGVDPVAEAGVRPWVGQALGAPGGGADGDAGGGALPRLLGRADVAMLPEALAIALGVGEGDVLTLRSGGKSTRLEVVAVLPAGRTPQGAEDLVLMDIPAAQRVLGRPGQLSRVDLVVDDAGAARLAAALPVGLEVAATLERDAALGAISAAFETNLRALSLLALLVGVFLVFQTLGFMALRRRGLIGLWRAMGVSRGELARLFLAEALLLGLVAGLMGMALGVLIAGQLLETVTRTYNDLYYRVAVGQLALSPGVFLKAGLLALGGALVGAAWPLRDALAVPPLANLRRAGQALSTARRVRRGLWPALGLMLVAALVLWLAPPTLGVAFVAIFAMLMAALGLVPALALGLLVFAERVLGPRLPVLGRLLISGTRLGLDRTGIALAALALAIATLIGMSTMIHSFREGVSDWISLSLQADLYLSHPSGEDGLPSGLPERLLAIDGVEALTLNRRRSVMAEDGPMAVLAVDMPARGIDGYDFVEGSPEAAWAGFQAGELLVSEPLATRLGLAVGDRFALPTPGGPVSRRVAAVYRDYTSSQGVATLSRAQYLQLYDDPRINAIGVYAEAGRAEALAVAVRAEVGSGEGVSLVTAEAIREETLRVFQRTFAVTDLLRLLAGVIAVVAVLGALLALQLERLREVVLMRAIGVGAAALARLQLWQAMLLGALAGVLAIPLGVMLAALLIRVINRRSFGWSMPLELPLGQIAFAVGLALAASLVAGLLPARRAARMPLAPTLREQAL
ncbi:FtsX-like permease family protein [Alkalisalibacterium limincola]|uniref:FtsX-like permease family protein n=1 Tax=Alkalisalibacterium limincola TaxID=2699169 RepID=A0A5C8KY65_9GAMM|nr:FtsX-like permease family protein [Alkalisalibacterium limincola]TXK65988.1 FtsX-like permease family protein [Alkalisalibacterium limincola]